MRGGHAMSFQLRSRGPRVSERARQALVEGLHQLGLAVRDNAAERMPRGAPPVHVADSGTVVSYDEGREVVRSGPGTVREAEQPQLGTVVGFGFPSRFLETGTVNMSPRPSLGPAIDEEATSEALQREVAARWPRGTAEP